MVLDLKDLSIADVQHYLQHAVAPRPYLFCSTIDKAGNINLARLVFLMYFLQTHLL